MAIQATVPTNDDGDIVDAYIRLREHYGKASTDPDTDVTTTIAVAQIEIYDDASQAENDSPYPSQVVDRVKVILPNGSDLEDDDAILTALYGSLKEYLVAHNQVTAVTQLTNITDV
jgi:hypothetical protein